MKSISNIETTVSKVRMNPDETPSFIRGDELLSKSIGIITKFDNVNNYRGTVDSKNDLTIDEAYIMSAIAQYVYISGLEYNIEVHPAFKGRTVMGRLYNNRLDIILSLNADESLAELVHKTKGVFMINFVTSTSSTIHKIKFNENIATIKLQSVRAGDVYKYRIKNQFNNEMDEDSKNIILAAEYGSAYNHKIYDSITYGYDVVHGGYTEETRDKILSTIPFRVANMDNRLFERVFNKGCIRDVIAGLSGEKYSTSQDLTSFEKYMASKNEANCKLRLIYGIIQGIRLIADIDNKNSLQASEFIKKINWNNCDITAGIVEEYRRSRKRWFGYLPSKGSHGIDRENQQLIMSEYSKIGKHIETYYKRYKCALYVKKDSKKVLVYVNQSDVVEVDYDTPNKLLKQVKSECKFMKENVKKIINSDGVMMYIAKK